MTNNYNWREYHRELIEKFLVFLNSLSNKYVLKGGTSLMLCYNLDRFSEDIDLDGFDDNIEDLVDIFCREYNIKYRVGKDTGTVKRFLLHYNSIKPLKVEVSYRIKNVDIERNAQYINGILVYRIQNILSMKLNAYDGRDKLRDMYDVAFIANNYWGHIDEGLRFRMRDTIARKGVEQFDYLSETQEDELIDKEKLQYMFMTMWELLGLN